MMRRGKSGGSTQVMLRQMVVAVVMAGGTASAGADEALQDAWWTGPMLAPNAATLPQGHALIEPYLFDVMTVSHFDTDGLRHAGPYDHELGSLTYMLYGVTDQVTVGLIPRFFYDEPAGAPNSSVAVGDLTLQAAYGLTQFQEGRQVPAIALVLDETVPSGRYDNLARASDGFGAGAYTSGFSVYSQDYFWMPSGRILRVRLDLTYAISSSVSVRNLSVYGTANGFSGRASPGDSFTGDASAEYSLTRNWVLALDVVYQHNGNTQVSGSLFGQPADGAFQSASGSSYSIGFAPAIEYNFSSRVGLLLGVRIIQIGRNSEASVTPAIALNMVF